MRATRPFSDTTRALVPSTFGSAATRSLDPRERCPRRGRVEARRRAASGPAARSARPGRSPPAPAAPSPCWESTPGTSKESSSSRPTAPAAPITSTDDGEPGADHGPRTAGREPAQSIQHQGLLRAGGLIVTRTPLRAHRKSGSTRLARSDGADLVLVADSAAGAGSLRWGGGRRRCPDAVGRAPRSGRPRAASGATGRWSRSCCRPRCSRPRCATIWCGPASRSCWPWRSRSRCCGGARTRSRRSPSRSARRPRLGVAAFLGPGECGRALQQRVRAGPPVRPLPLGLGP